MRGCVFSVLILMKQCRCCCNLSISATRLSFSSLPHSASLPSSWTGIGTNTGITVSLSDSDSEKLSDDDDESKLEFEVTASPPNQPSTGTVWTPEPDAAATLYPDAEPDERPRMIRVCSS